MPCEEMHEKTVAASQVWGLECHAYAGESLRVDKVPVA
jgi:hypothetical protein